MRKGSPMGLRQSSGSLFIHTIVSRSGNRGNLPLLQVPLYPLSIPLLRIPVATSTRADDDHRVACSQNVFPFIHGICLFSPDRNRRLASFQTSKQPPGCNLDPRAAELKDSLPLH